MATPRTFSIVDIPADFTIQSEEERRNYHYGYQTEFPVLDASNLFAKLGFDLTQFKAQFLMYRHGLDNNRGHSYGYYNRTPARTPEAIEKALLNDRSDITLSEVNSRIDDDVATFVISDDEVATAEIVKLMRLNSATRDYYVRDRKELVVKFEKAGKTKVVHFPMGIDENEITVSDDCSVSFFGCVIPFEKVEIPDNLNSTLMYYLGMEGHEHFFKHALKNTTCVGFPSVKDGKTIINKMIPLYRECWAVSPVHSEIFRLICEQASKTISTIKVSTLLGTEFADVTTVEQFIEKLEPVYKAAIAQSDRYWGSYGISSFFTGQGAIGALSSFSDSHRKATRNSAVKRLYGLKDLDLSEEKHPLTFAALNNGDIPVTAISKNEANGNYFYFNDNWDLVEPMLQNHREITLEILKAVATRTTYQKDVMSYFYFLLHELPEYLDKHAPPEDGKHWSCIPKLVDSERELEQEDTPGTTKRRSALTPTVNMETYEVTVPLAHLKIYGRNTTYCYAHSYVLLRKGTTFDGSTCTKDLEEKLNTVDDYGLMFYTLTGTEVGRGAPTFLIIFERLENKTNVIFHRCNPVRSKDGDRNPIHNWIKTCYAYMWSFLPTNEIRATQGDLAFAVSTKEVGDDLETVTDYDSHRFEVPVKFLSATETESKTRIIGYVKLDREMTLSHPEHRNRIIPAGTYQIRQCRSFEANPKGVWSLRID